MPEFEQNIEYLKISENNEIIKKISVLNKYINFFIYFQDIYKLCSKFKFVASGFFKGEFISLCIAFI